MLKIACKDWTPYHIVTFQLTKMPEAGIKIKVLEIK